nr:tetratricopeptide repeat-containing glycosyltransferase family protein [Azospirillum soli]
MRVAAGVSDTASADLRTALEQALALIRAGRPEDAETLCRDLATRFPANADSHHLHGLAALSDKRATDALPRLARAVALAPDVASFRTNLGTAQQGSGASDQAERGFRRALRIAPDQAETSFNLANLLLLSNRPEEAEPFLRRAVALQPERAKYWVRLGNLFLGLRRDRAAVRAYEIANVTAGGHCDGTAINHGMALHRMNRLAEALVCYDRALADNPDNAVAHWNRALTLLLSGRLTEGWDEYEWRWRLAECQPRPFDRPLWTGEALDGRILLVHAEQGLGDTLHLVRYLPLVMEQAAARGGKLVLECQPPLSRLLADSFPGVAVVPAGDPLPAFDAHLPLLSLPRVFRTKLDDIPSSTPYLRAPGGAVLPPGRPGTLAVGLVWGGDPAHRNDRQRSLDLEALQALLAIPGVTFYSVQKGDKARALADADREGVVVDLGPAIGDFTDTAAFLQRMDWVVTVDTSVAHLAGALGRSVCVMLPYSPDWRWLLDRSDSPWYPTATLFRQATPGDWTGVVRAVAAHLTHTRTTPAVGPGRRNP